VVPIATRALIFGASGQVGAALQETVPEAAAIVAHDSATTNICDRDAVARAIRDAQPDVVINCAAFTNVDDAETRTDDAFVANAVAPGIIAELATRAGARMIHLSTDYVFDGQAHAPYLPDAPVGPLNAYGATKLEGERRVLAAAPESVVVRTAWVHSGRGTNFIRTTVRLLTGGTPMRVVDDQIGTPTRAAHLAEALWRIAAQRDIRGVLHFTDAGVASWFDVAVVVHETLRSAGRLGAGAGVSAARSEDFPRPARRPQFSVLDKHASWARIGRIPPHWAEGVVASTMELLNA
jgi:dTDP-4-dehydrorhamnose reductase